MERYRLWSPLIYGVNFNSFHWVIMARKGKSGKTKSHAKTVNPATVVVTTEETARQTENDPNEIIVVVADFSSTPAVSVEQEVSLNSESDIQDSHPLDQSSEQSVSGTEELNVSDSAKYSKDALDVWYKGEADSAAEKTVQVALPSGPTDFKVGDILNDTFEILDLLGEGGMGQVFRVKHLHLKKEFALKTMRLECLDEISIKRFKMEIRAIAQMHHPNIVKVHNADVANGIPYYVMDLLTGETLRGLVKRSNQMDVREVCRMFDSIADGLAYAHRHGIIHRDIKPTNIILEEENGRLCPKIVDFGLAKVVGQNSTSDQLTKSGEVFGSAYYMSPEQCRGDRVTPTTDIYSLGCTLFEALTGTPPFIGETIVQTFAMHQNNIPPTLRHASLGREFPQKVEFIVAKTLQKLSHRRYAHMEELSADLKNFLLGRELEYAFAPQYADLPVDYPESERKVYESSFDLPWLKIFGTIAALFVGLIVVICTAGIISAAIQHSDEERAERDRYNTEIALQEASRSKAKTNAAATVNPSIAAASPDEQMEKYQDTKTPFVIPAKSNSKVITFSFPESWPIGQITYFASDELSGRRRQDAQGNVSFPSDALLHFYPNKRCSLFPKLYRRFNANDLCAITMNSEATDTDDQIHCLNDLTGLKVLDVRGTDISAEALPDLDKLDLATLRVGDSIDGASLARFQKLKSLRALELARTLHHTIVLEALLKSRLNKLKLSNIHLSSTDLELISRIPKLERLELENCTTPDYALKHLAGMKSLRQFQVTGVKWSPVWVKVFTDLSSQATIFVDPEDWSEEGMDTMSRLTKKVKVLDRGRFSDDLDWGIPLK